MFDVGEGKVLKAFRRVSPAVAPRVDPTLIPRIAFNAELRAYTRLQSQPDLALFAPAFFGSADPSSFPITNPGSYCTSCGLVIEKIAGEPIKIAALSDELLGGVELVLEQMQDRIILDDPWDGSCFIPGSRAPFTLIDFATPSEHFAALDGILRIHGELPPSLRAPLGLDEAS